MATRKTRDADVAGIAEFVPWSEFLATRFRWRQGEHISLIGPTGGGKTTLALGLLPHRRRTVIYACKPRDDTLGPLTRRNPPGGERYTRVKSWPPPALVHRAILWPRGRDLQNDVGRQQQTFHEANQRLYQTGAWCVFVDDLWFQCEVLKLAKDYQMLLANGRSLKLSLIGAIQRPAHVPLMFYDQPTHLFFWNDPDEDNRRRIASIGQADPKLVRQLVASLPPHHALYVQTRTGEILTTRAERIG